MRELLIKKRAENALNKVARYLAAQYFPSTGEKFIHEFIDHCLVYSSVNVKYPLCRSEMLAKRGFSCFVFKRKWIVAFKYSDDNFQVCRFIYGPRLK